MHDDTGSESSAHRFWSYSGTTLRPAREGNALPPAVVVQDAVDEFRAVIAIEPDQGHRQAFPYCLYPRRDPRVTFPPERLQLDPAGRHVDGAQGVQVEPLGAAAAV